MIEILAASLLVMLASLVGVFSLWRRAEKIIERNLDFLVSFSAGVFVVIVYRLAVETIEHAGQAVWGFTWILVGALFIWVICKLLPATHMHAEPGDETRVDPRKILVSDSIHNVGDGVLLAATFSVSVALGIATTASVLIHEVLQEISEFFILRKGGYTPQKALSLNFLTSSSILVGSVGGFFFLELFEYLESPLLGFAAGALLVVVLTDLIPHSISGSYERSHYAKHLLLFLIGVALMLAVSVFAAH
ncbi:ZIP family metal transporter [Patescibacteria group bacterium]|nr:ZIP family metal transporter [Patescibacteria group bacterium]